MRKIIIGTFSLILATVLLADSVPGITGNVISSSTGVNLPSICGLVLLICGLWLFFLDLKERSSAN